MRNTRFVATSFAAVLICLTCSLPASAFSQLGRQDGTLPKPGSVIQAPLPPLSGAPAADATGATGTSNSEPTAATGGPAPAAAPAPDPAATGAAAAPGADAQSPGVAPDQPGTPPAAAPDGNDAAPDNGGDEDGIDPQASQQALPEQPQGPPPDVAYGDAELPQPVRDLRAKLIEIAKSGDIERLRPYIETGEDGTVLSFGGVDGDPIQFLKSASGDGEGVETLAILLEVLQSGHIRSEPATDNEIYVWPYFSGLAIDKLTKPQKVELFELITAGDYQEMVGFGAYNFYRVGISPDGKLQFFVAGD